MYVFIGKLVFKAKFERIREVKRIQNYIVIVTFCDVSIFPKFSFSLSSRWHLSYIKYM